MSELISDTPIWDFIVFCTLLVLGIIQTKERTVKVNTVFNLPIAMIISSFFGVYSVFGLSLVSIGIWLLGLIIALVIGLILSYPKQVSYSQQEEKLTISGSKIPLVFMMVIFFTKYFIGFAFARDLPLVNEFIFLVVICLSYGVFSGIFLSRSIVIFKASKVSA